MPVLALMQKCFVEYVFRKNSCFLEVVSIPWGKLYLLYRLYCRSRKGMS